MVQNSLSSVKLLKLHRACNFIPKLVTIVTFVATDLYTFTLYDYDHVINILFETIIIVYFSDVIIIPLKILVCMGWAVSLKKNAALP